MFLIVNLKQGTSKTLINEEDLPFEDPDYMFFKIIPEGTVYAPSYDWKGDFTGWYLVP